MDKRQHERTSIEPLEMVFDEIEGNHAKHENVTVFIENVSSEGMLFTSNVDFTTNESIHFHLPTIGIFTLFSGKIVWKKEMGVDLYQYGLYICKDNK
ncbi:PilZ domain-containing protein [Paenibacillus alginolyticus]|uniref:PilZ domain-containing protein n=1 Tax=Paenibacillus alginolyticus TaxID=59839 RepID=A0ABT4GQM6_9BACL|nr:PilZ domain-containing protein [Paenibacillus alginolyticus]MCY9666531.1 PilZ domain-containing protein [Paenibacillus alginolyticus]MCY9698361.1 PilZ domain-containing protein [Paenibacillus alginolyticus]MEC0147718.1 PilZ domain-containing protein [Paenibacillus alginolyticus]